MFGRDIHAELLKWKDNPNRKPLIIRGARQVGKTTVVNQFGAGFQQYIYLNLEREDDAKPFREINDIGRLVEAVFFLKNKSRQIKDTLLFIDEIQEVPGAINQLRYFYEQMPELYVVAAGSLLETTLNENVHVPVGRVEYKVVRPVSFREFLGVLGETAALEQLSKIPIADFAHDKILRLFHAYSLIGGMPEVVNHYATHRDIAGLQSIYESLIISYLTDVEKYARNTTLTQVMRHCIRASYPEAGSRITFQGFGHSNYGSREVGEAMRTLEKAMLIHLVYPTVYAVLPLLADMRKSPRLQVLDTGLLNHFAGIQKSVLGASDLQSVYQGKIAEHIVGQEILASHYGGLHQLHFWTREKKGASAETDFVIPCEGLLIPVEVKAGATGKLKSLHQFMDLAPHAFAVRLYAGTTKIDSVETTGGKKYTLLSMPYYLASQLNEYGVWLMNQ